MLGWVMLEMTWVGLTLVWFGLVWFISLFEKMPRKIPARKNSRGKDLTGKRPSGEKT